MPATAVLRSLPEWPLTRPRDGSNPIERKAVYRAQVEICSMPASLVVQIALWPDKLADWAKDAAISPSVVYNMLANVKPYHRVRTLLARRLDVPKEVLDHLIEAARPEPRAKVPPAPPESSNLPAPPRGGRVASAASGSAPEGDGAAPAAPTRRAGRRRVRAESSRPLSPSQIALNL